MVGFCCKNKERNNKKEKICVPGIPAPNIQLGTHRTKTAFSTLATNCIFDVVLAHKVIFGRPTAVLYFASETHNDVD